MYSAKTTSIAGGLINRIISPFVLALLLALIGAIQLHAENSGPVHKANWELAQKWHPLETYARMYSISVTPNWLPQSEVFWYRYLTSDGRHYWLVDARKGTREPLFDRLKLASELNRLMVDSLDGENLDLSNLEVTDDQQAIEFEVNRINYRYDREREILAIIDTAMAIQDDGELWCTPSPDSAMSIHQRANNLYVREIGDRDSVETQLTFDGEDGLSWGSEWDLFDADDTEPRPADGYWSPDSRFFCLKRADVRQVNDLWLVQHLSEPRPTLTTFKYPMPGERAAQWEIWVYDRSARQMVAVDTKRWPDQTLDDLFINDIWWSPDSKTLYFTRRSRDYFSVDLCAVNPATGESRVVIEERLNNQVYIRQPVLLPDTDELIWWSMRSGWGHFYLIDSDGRLRNQVTKGEFTADEIVAVDTTGRVLYFLGIGKEDGRNPYYRHLYSVDFDGSNLQLLSPEDAEHSCHMSPSRGYFVDHISRVDMPSRSALRDNRGNLVIELETADVSELMEAGWKPPEVFRAKAADGVTDLWGVMYKPFDLDPKRKYPIVTRGYPGRFSEFIPRSFWPVHAELFLAQLGCIVVRFGNRGGTYERGLAYRSYGQDDFRDFALADKRAVIEQLAARHRFIDIDRVGICGSSSGGFLTVSAMLVHSDFYKVGVAMSAANDPSIYYKQWVERYQGVKQVTDEDGTMRWEAQAATNLELAGNLQGRLLMINGAQDENVHPAHLFRMANALIEANKRFDMFIVPNGDHNLGDWRYLYGLIWDYFAEHLIGDRRNSVNCIGSE